MEALFSHVSAAPGLALGVVLIAFLASIVQFGLGMGFGLMAAPLLALIDPELVPAPTLFIGLLTSAWGAAREYQAIRWDEVFTAMVGRLIGVALAMAVLATVASRDGFSLVFGGLIALAVAMSVVGWRMAFTRPNLVGMATLSGLMATITSVGAPPLAVIYQDRPAAQARPTLAAFFAVGCAISLCALYLSGWATVRDLFMALLMVPGVVAGAILAPRIGAQVNRRYRPLLLVVAAGAALLLIARGLT